MSRLGTSSPSGTFRCQLRCRLIAGLTPLPTASVRGLLKVTRDSSGASLRRPAKRESRRPPRRPMSGREAGPPPRRISELEPPMSSERSATVPETFPSCCATGVASTSITTGAADSSSAPVIGLGSCRSDPPSVATAAENFAPALGLARATAGEWPLSCLCERRNRCTKPARFLCETRGLPWS